MSPDQARASYRRQIAAHGETVSLRRGVGGPGQQASVRARVTGFSPEEIASGIDQGDRKIIMLAEDVEAAIAGGNWPVVPAGGRAIAKGDRVWLRDGPLVVQDVDESTRRIAGVLIAFEITATGS